MTYQYDQLNRLSHAETLDNSWGLSYGYDGFGNLTAKTITKGTPPLTWTGFTVAYDPATNHGAGYDANGNAPVGGQYPYDVENRLTQPVLSPSWSVRTLGDGNYVYDPWGKRVGWRFPGSTGIVGADPETKCEVHFYGITGQKLASYSCGYHDAEGGDGTFYWSLKGYNVYFAGHLVQSNGVSVTTDRLGSVRANGSGERFNYLPNGEERTPTPDGREKFATYLRDNGGLDYADQRFYDRGNGRFLTPDPSTGSNPADPGSWNKYAYVQGDPINFYDPPGTNIWNPDSPRDAWAGYQAGGFIFFYGWTDGGYGIAGAGAVSGSPGGPTDPSGDDQHHAPPYYQTHPCDGNDSTNARILDFIGAHEADAKELATQVNLPWEWILGVSAAETTYGTEGIAFSGTPPTNNFFGLHVNGEGDTSHYLFQISTYHASQDGWVATFAAATGFLDSGLGFLYDQKPFISGAKTVDQFANAVHAHGYGVGSDTYISKLTSAISNITTRENCNK